MRKFQEIVENAKFDEIRDNCKELFFEVWHDKLLITKLEIQSLNVDNEYSRLYVKVFNSFNDHYYKNFRLLFDMLDKLNIKFDYNSGHDINIYIDDIQEFIDELELTTDTKKYNL